MRGASNMRSKYKRPFIARFLPLSHNPQPSVVNASALDKLSAAKPGHDKVQGRNYSMPKYMDQQIFNLTSSFQKALAQITIAN